MTKIYDEIFVKISKDDVLEIKLTKDIFFILHEMKCYLNGVLYEDMSSPWKDNEKDRIRVCGFKVNETPYSISTKWNRETGDFTLQFYIMK